MPKKFLEKVFLSDPYYFLEWQYFYRQRIFFLIGCTKFLSFWNFIFLTDDFDLECLLQQQIQLTEEPPKNRKKTHKFKVATTGEKACFFDNADLDVYV